MTSRLACKGADAENRPARSAAKQPKGDGPGWVGAQTATKRQDLLFGPQCCVY